MTAGVRSDAASSPSAKSGAQTPPSSPVDVAAAAAGVPRAGELPTAEDDISWVRKA